MELDEFVKNTMLQITKGVQAAQADEDVGQHISPKLRRGSNEGPETTQRLAVQAVDFDVAVTAATTKEGAAGGGIQVAGLSIGGGGTVAAENQTISRIRFQVGLALPQIGTLGKEVDPPRP